MISELCDLMAYYEMMAKVNRGNVTPTQALLKAVLDDIIAVWVSPECIFLLLWLLVCSPFIFLLNTGYK